jgi:type I restriction enzyme S subunit
MSLPTTVAAPATVRTWQPYPAYKDSGVEWLGEIPAHWEVKRLRFICYMNPSKSEVTALPANTEVSFLPMDRIGEEGELSLEETRAIGNVREGYTYFRDGDVLVAKITPCFENGKGALCAGLTHAVGFGTTELHVMRAQRDADPKFVFYLTRSHAFRAIGVAMMQGAAGQQRVPEEFIKDFQPSIPPLPEQRAIAAFLDRETARIDALVAKKERLIALLREKRAALISHAVTRGLDPAAPLRDSGVPWLGPVPAHWEVRRLKHVSTLQTGLTLGKEYIGERLVTRPYLRVANVQDGYLDLSDVATISVPTREVTQYELHAGDVLMTEGGDFDKLGRGYVWEGQIEGCLHQNHIFVVRPDTRRLVARFLALAMSSWHGRTYFTVTSKQTTNLASTNSTTLRSFRLPLPPVQEQWVIVAFLDRKAAEIDALISTIRQQIEKLKEHRTALIAAAVTGKIDVRGMGGAEKAEEAG